MEPRFGPDFSAVRVHTDAQAGESARSVHALAYTVGRDIVFGQGLYSPGTSKGKRLIAHELAHVVPRVQPKLTVGPADDAYEREADRVAEAVMRMPEPEGRIQRACPECEEEMQRNPLNASRTGERIQRLCPECEEEVQRQPAPEEEEDEEKTLRTKETPGRIPEVTPDLESRIAALRRSGQPLPSSERAFFEPRFGQHFSDVRIHSGPDATDLAQRVQARAFTLGRSVVFNQGEFQPGTESGRRLVAHELTHVVQQRGSLGSAQQVVRRRTVRRYYATAKSERSPLCDVRLVITRAPGADTDDLTEFVNAAMDGIRAACGTLPRASSRAIRVKMRYRRRMEYSDVSQRAYIEARVSVLGEVANPAHIAAQERIAGARARMVQLDSNYQDAVRTGDWQMAAERLNGFNDTDIASRLRRLSLTQLGELRRGAVANPRLGGGARLTAAIDRVNADARRVAALIDSYESALAARSWETAAEHLNGFNDTDIRERLGRLNRLQLSSLRDGAIRNPRLGRGARLVGLIDSVTAPPLLLGVGAACFEGATITVTKNRATHSCPAFSGNVGAPTPSGRFCIRRQGEAIVAGGLWGRVVQNRRVWYLLEPQFSTTRFKMILHPGVMSEGCITVNDRTCFDQLAAVLNSPGTDTGRGFDGFPPGNSRGVTNPERSVDCVAWLDVTSTRGGCGP